MAWSPLPQRSRLLMSAAVVCLLGTQPSVHARPAAGLPFPPGAVVVVVGDNITHAALMAAIWAAPTGGLLRDAQLFDVYRPKLAKDAAPAVDGVTDRSLAVRLTLNSDEATLTEAQIDAVIAAQLAQLSAQLNARLRA